MKKLALALATVAPLALAGTASAKDMKGRFGVGGQLDTNGAAGLSLKYWVSDLGFQGILGYQMVGESGTDTKDNTSEFDVTLRLLYNIARANDTNLYAGAGVTLGLYGGGDNVPDRDASVFVDLVLGVEHYFTDYFSVAGQVGLHIDTGDQFRLAIGNVSSWGTAFHFYF
ncbi:MAG: hypothetical protein JNJ59_04400 [Deltaproteobacteria bacterium]|nr:hypothetical protein [Deltaproteobacteria bacterium]